MFYKLKETILFEPPDIRDPEMDGSGRLISFPADRTLPVGQNNGGVTAPSSRSHDARCS